MSHIPVDHPLRPLYRVLAALAGIFLLVFGIVGVTQTRGTDFFAQTGLPWVLGLRTNLALAVLSIAAGVVLVAGTAIGHNVDHVVDLVGGAVFMLVGMIMLGLVRTDADILGFSAANCIVSLLIGVVLFTAGLYGRTATPIRRVRTEG